MANSRSLQGYRAVISLAKLDELVADFGIAPAHVSAVAFVILMLSGFSAPRCEATVYDSDGSEASVRALHNIAHDGDTITLPAGTSRKKINNAARSVFGAFLSRADCVVDALF